MIKLTIFLVVIACSHCCFTRANPRNDLWNDLKITWGPNTASPDYFVSLPRTETAALQAGWTLEKDCSQINGRRYSKAGDREILLVYGANKLIAGISISVPKNLPFNFPSSQIQPYFVDEGTSYTFTAYFVDPTKVCTSTDVKQATGDRVVIKGSTKEINIPLLQTDIDSQKFWTKGKCFPTMGVHYWTDIRGIPMAKTTPSDYFFPIFLLYNRGYLNGFGWAFNANLTSPRLEHPTPEIVSNFMDPVPDFIFDPTKTGVLSTLHIYLDSTPGSNYC